ncbi:hypothetical protein BKA69DRAFT_591039 [Paraphysoderma sedebokerense]|nr:hypothetical protein BKA69DRAFT_591039 [Paraphysoderma sedebokerense]
MTKMAIKSLIEFLFFAICFQIVVSQFTPNADVPIDDIADSLERIIPAQTTPNLQTAAILESDEVFSVSSTKRNLQGPIDILKTRMVLTPKANDGIVWRNEEIFGIRRLKPKDGRFIELHLPAVLATDDVERLVLDIENDRLYYTADHYKHFVPYSKEFESFMPIHSLATLKSFSQSLQMSKPDLTSYYAYATKWFDAGAAFETQFRRRLTPTNLEAWKNSNDDVFRYIKNSYMKIWDISKPQVTAPLFKTIKTELVNAGVITDDNNIEFSSHTMLRYAKTNGSPTNIVAEYFLIAKKGNGQRFETIAKKVYVTKTKFKYETMSFQDGVPTWTLVSETQGTPKAS